MTLTPERARVALVGAGLWILVDVQRVWTPSLITIFGRAAETPAALIGGFAILVCAVPLLLTRVLPRTDPVTDLALAGLVLCRVSLLVTDGGRPQLVLSTLGTAFGIWWLALAVGRRAASLAPGLAWGLLLATTAHAFLGTYGAVWRRDVWGVLELVVQVALVVLASLATDRGGVFTPGRAASWLVFPVLLLDGVLFTNVGRASALVGASGPAVAVAGAALAVALASLRANRVSSVLASAVLVAATVVGMLVAGPSPLFAPAFLLGAGAAAHLLAATVGERVDGHGGAPFVAAGAVVWVLLFFTYYAGYDLGYRADLLIVLLAVVVAAAGLWDREARLSLPRPTPLFAVVGVVGVLLAFVGPSVTLPSPKPPPSRSASLRLASDPPTRVESLRVGLWNLRMGYGLDGRFDARAVAKLVLAQDADVVLLSEIDRGWLLNGGQDQLEILARLTGLHVAFGPAADQVWGDAILSRFPLHDVVSRPFPSYGAVTGAEALEARISWHGKDVILCSTHLQPRSGGTDDTAAQAADLARLMRRYAELGSVVVGGDLNTRPRSVAWARLTRAGLADALAAARPLRTSPADAPAEQIDHVFVSPDLVGLRAQVVDSGLSDHLPVFVDVAERDQ